jgi:hypothetical protein
MTATSVREACAIFVGNIERAVSERGRELTEVLAAAGVSEELRGTWTSLRPSRSRRSSVSRSRSTRTCTASSLVPLDCLQLATPVAERSGGRCHP